MRVGRAKREIFWDFSLLICGLVLILQIDWSVEDNNTKRLPSKKKQSEDVLWLR